MPKEYLQAPNFDIPPPPSGPLKLGHILVEPDEPRYPLNEYDLTPPLESETYTQTATGFSATRSQLSETSFKLWAKLTDLVPIGADATDTRTTNSTDVFNIKTVDTLFFLPNKRYLENSVKSSDDVKDFLEGKRWGAEVFIITGLKVAHGASVTTYKLKESESSAEASASLSALNVPVGIGAAAGSGKAAEEVTSIGNLGAFVLGYQLRKIKYKKGKPLKNKPHNDGAVFDVDLAERPNNGEDDLEIEGLEDKDLVPNTSKWEGICPSEFADERIWIRNE